MATRRAPLASRVRVTLPAMYAAQERALCGPKRFAVVEASTKAGKTLGALLWQLQGLLEVGGVHWWVAPVYRQAEIAFRRAVDLVPAVVRARVDRSDMMIETTSGGRWEFRSGEQPDNLYGEDVRSAVLDEASRMREEAWHAVRSTLTATQGPARIIGNVRGRRSWCYRIARRAEAGDLADWSYARITARDAVAGGVITQAEIDAARAVLPEHIYRELYEAEASDDGGNPFGLDAIAACVRPMSSAPPFVWGWDVARSRDWTVGIAIDRTGAVCRVERWQRTWQDSIAEITDLTGRCGGYIDATGVGAPVHEAVIARGCALDPFAFTGPSKQALMEQLAYAIRRHAISIPEGVVRRELEAFEFVHDSRGGVRYSAPDGEHDDAVCALAMAWRAAEEAGVSPSRSATVRRPVTPVPRAQTQRVGEWRRPVTAAARRIVA